MDSDLDWLPDPTDWQQMLDQAKLLELPEAMHQFRLLALSRMDHARTVKLDRAVQKCLEQGVSLQVAAPLAYTKVRLALLGSSTLTHLVPAIRVAGLRRSLLIEVYESDYGTYRQELADSTSRLHAFQPAVVLLALDARHLIEIATADDQTASADRALEVMRLCWRTAKSAFACAVVQQAALSVFPPMLGNQEHTFAGSPAPVLESINAGLRVLASSEAVSVLAIDVFAREQGLRRWHDAGLWHRAKQEMHPSMAPVYGEQVARVVASLVGRTAKCLVLDLDNTLWGGVIGDDGLEGIVLGNGSAAGEAYLEFQRYARALRQRGVVLAVCSKNDQTNALLPFQQHPEMALRQDDIACFVANWDDKPSNLRHIAKTLNLGLDALVFVDDNPAERALVRRELPMVAVPEMPEDPAEYVRVLAAAGYFEALRVTSEDRERGELYKANAGRAAATETATDLECFLASLHMQLHWRPFDATGRARIVQLLNKTNQFNLVTRRFSDAEIDQLAARTDVLTMQIRLKDAYGDNGMIAVVFGQVEGLDLSIDTWAMSCRVLGRQVEDATMNLIVEQARIRGMRRIFGRYTPSARNGMVREHYRRMGFKLAETEPDGSTRWVLATEDYQPRPTQIHCLELELAAV